MEDQIWGEVRRRKMKDRKMEDQVSYIDTDYTHKSVTYKKHSNLMNCLQNGMQKVNKQFNNTYAQKTVYSHEAITN